jgi:dTDP-4-dehydrorhamnose 3,5-epimerase-like enzyme
VKGFQRIDIETSRDDRGWVSNLLDFLPIKPKSLQNIHLVAMNPGAVRGNHVHQRQIEGICVLGGDIQVKAIGQETNESHEETLTGESPVLFVVSPGIAHAFKNVGEKVVYLACYTDTAYDFEQPDSAPVPLF